jgi:solute carrier family 35, member F5
MQLFFGFVGLFNTVACWPIGVILHFTGVERFELPTSGRAVGGLLANVSFFLKCFAQFPSGSEKYV